MNKFTKKQQKEERNMIYNRKNGKAVIWEIF